MILTRNVLRCMLLIPLLIASLFLQSSKAQSKTSVSQAKGYTVATFAIEPGTIWVYLPDDIAIGDKVSGTVMAVPRGDLDLLKSFVLEIDGHQLKPFNVACEADETKPCLQMFFLYQAGETARSSGLVLKAKDGTAVGAVDLPPLRGDFDPDSKNVIPPGGIVPKHPSGAVITPGPYTKRPPAQSDFNIPALGQTSRPLIISGPFDGDLSNTRINIGPAGSTAQDFEKNSENVSGGFGLFRPLVESPRKAVFHAPKNFIGPVEIRVKDGDVQTQNAYRNIGVSLSAPKTNLARDEQTTLTVEVIGLTGIVEPVSLEIDATGVITMGGGNFQNLRIMPAEINTRGIYTTSRPITGQQKGSFTVTATVIAGRYNVCIADDSNRDRALLWNTFTGDYLIAQTGLTKPQSGQVQPSRTTRTGVASTTTMKNRFESLTGTGQVTMDGCSITLTHNAPDRRIMSRLDTCTKTGEASVETTSPGSTPKITDTNVSDNYCGFR